MRLDTGIEYSVCLEKLADAFPNGLLSDGKEVIHTRVGGIDYYDLKDSSGRILCMDGEPCMLLTKNENGSAVFRNTCGEENAEFSLSKIEMEIVFYRSGIKSVHFEKDDAGKSL